MKLQYTDKSEIPEGQADSFVEFKEGDSTVFMHKDLAEQKKETFRLKGDLSKTSEQLNGLKEKVEGFESEQQKREREAREREEANKLKNGQHDEVIAALRKDLENAKAEGQQKVDELMQQTASEKKKALIAQLGSAATKGNEPILSRMIADDLDVSADGTVVVKDADGKVTGLTVDQYRQSLTDRYPTLVAAVQSSGGLAQGGAGGEAGATGNNKELAHYQKAVTGFKDLPIR